MEFKLNKIDVEIRQRVKDTTKSGIIHRKESITVNKDRNPKDNSSLMKNLRTSFQNIRKNIK